MRRRIILGLALALTAAAPATAMARPGFVTTDVHLRAGPSTNFPVVTTIFDGARVHIHGCLHDYKWCDVSWRGDRGWIYARYLQFRYGHHRVRLPRFAARIDLPIVGFSVGRYWHRHYRHRHFYSRRDYWRDRYRHHTRHERRRGRDAYYDRHDRDRYERRGHDERRRHERAADRRRQVDRQVRQDRHEPPDEGRSQRKVHRGADAKVRDRERRNQKRYTEQRRHGDKKKQRHHHDKKKSNRGVELHIGPNGVSLH